MGDVTHKQEGEEEIESSGMECSKSYIVIDHTPGPPVPNGTPQYNVKIINKCPTNCRIGHIHLHCGWFSSAVLINPNVFVRIFKDDCLVAGGLPLNAGSVISFTYANTEYYPLSVSSLTCL